MKAIFLGLGAFLWSVAAAYVLTELHTDSIWSALFIVALFICGGFWFSTASKL